MLEENDAGQEKRGKKEQVPPVVESEKAPDGCDPSLPTRSDMTNRREGRKKQDARREHRRNRVDDEDHRKRRSRDKACRCRANTHPEVDRKPRQRESRFSLL